MAHSVVKNSGVLRTEEVRSSLACGRERRNNNKTKQEELYAVCSTGYLTKTNKPPETDDMTLIHDVVQFQPRRPPTSHPEADTFPASRMKQSSRLLSVAIHVRFANAEPNLVPQDNHPPIPANRALSPSEASDKVKSSKGSPGLRAGSRDGCNSVNPLSIQYSPPSSMVQLGALKGQQPTV